MVEKQESHERTNSVPVVCCSRHVPGGHRHAWLARSLHSAHAGECRLRAFELHRANAGTSASPQSTLAAGAPPTQRMITGFGLRPAPIALRCLTCSVGPTYDLRWSPLGRAPSSGNVSQPRDCFFTGWQVSCSGCQRCFPWQPSMHHNSLWSPSTRCTIEAAWEERWTIILTTLLVLA